MADNFVSKIRVSSEDFVDAGGRPALERYGDLQALLTDRAGPEVAALFAEPLISRGNDTAPPTVSWYTQAEGEARPLSSLSAVDRDRAEHYLIDHLRPMRSLAHDPETADLALGALSILGKDDIVVVDGRPVIVNWGLLPAGQGANIGTHAAHYAATLGSYLPLRDPVATAEPGAAAAAAGDALPSQTASTPAFAGASAGAVPPPVPPPGATRAGISPIAWVPLVVLLVLAGLTLAWLLMPGTRLFHAAAPPVVTQAATLDAARALNESLRARQQALQSALDGATCRADGVLILPDGRTPEGLTPPALGVAPERKSEAAPDGLLPSSPDRVVVPGPEGASDETSLLALIEARTVLVLAAHAGGGNTGSGLVIGPGLIMTNQHVIADAMGEDGRILVAGAGLETPARANVIKATGPLPETGEDFALLQIEDAGLPAFTVYLPTQSLKLTNVVAAGFPGDVLEIDASFAALRSGTLTAVPDLTVTDGTVNTEQQLGPQTHVLMHSAPLSSGNSGGPLVDMCGRLVGVNSFVKQGKMQNRGFALTTGDMMAFLNGTPANPAVVSDPCAPLVVRPQVSAAPPVPAQD
jgi:S1-C subfamily serine protease